MRKLRVSCLLLSSIFSATALHASEDIALSVQQAQALDIVNAPLQKQDAALGAGLPAHVVIPNNQMHVVSAPTDGFVQAMLVAVNEEVKQGQALARLQSPALAQLNARETRYRLMLDAHLLWPLDKEEDAGDAEHVHY